MLQCCHKNVVQTHHVLMWQRAKAAIDDCTPKYGGAAGAAVQQEQPVLPPFDGSSAANGSGSMHGDADAAAAAAAAADASSQDERRLAGDALLLQLRIVQELCDGGPLDAAARNGKIATLECMLSCLLDVARGLEYLHSKGLMHGDLKANNVCLVSAEQAAAASAALAKPRLTSHAAPNGSAKDGGRSSNSSNLKGFDYVCKVMDFSLSKALDAGKSHCSTQSLGTITHVAPELLQTGKQSKAADVYSMGMLIWEVLHGGRTPFKHCRHSTEVMQLVLQGQRPAWQPGCSTQLIALAEQCWAADPAARPCISSVCEQLLQLQLEAQLQHIDVAGWPSAALPAPPAAAAGGDFAEQASAAWALPGAWQLQQGSSSSRGSGSSTGSAGSASLYGVAAAAVAAAAEAAAHGSNEPPAAAAAAAGVSAGRKPVCAVLQSCGESFMTLDQVLQAGLNPGKSSGSQAGGGAVSFNSSMVSLARRHSVALVDPYGAPVQQDRAYAVQARCIGSGRGDGGCGAGGSAAADVGGMHVFDSLLATGRKAVARGVDCSALDVPRSHEDVRQSGSASAVQQQQQQQQQWRLSSSGGNAAAAAVSAGDALGPTVGYWD
ncbi:kinase-like domain-containing protein [Scenedesmus sp. NREL 46B-D3]|nr:kinase-like domain-containing protein [Scenedesmus sp. NREL 46B-D3]